MKSNKYFKQFFKEYQSHIEKALDNMDSQAKKTKIAAANYYLCNEDYKPKVKDYMTEKNLYRKNNYTDLKSNEHMDNLFELINTVKP